MALEDVAPDGRAIVRVEDARDEISVFSSDGSGERVLPWLSSSLQDEYAISGDGRQVLVSAHAMEGRPEATAYLRPTDGSAPVRLGRYRPLDLSPDERWVAAMGEDPAALTLLPVAVGVSRRIRDDSFTNIGLGRFLHGGKGMVLEVLLKNQKQYRLFVVPIDGGPRTLLSDVPVDGWLEVSPDDRVVAVPNSEGLLTLFPLDRGPPVPLPGIAPGSEPAGWTSDGQLWIHGKPASSPGGPRRLLRYDVSRRQIVEERSVVPGDLTGFNRVYRVLITPDGRHTAIQYGRRLSSLYLLERLVQHN
jgi:hypothetical protein